MAGSPWLVSWLVPKRPYIHRWHLSHMQLSCVEATSHHVWAQPEDARGSVQRANAKVRCMVYYRVSYGAASLNPGLYALVPFS